MVFASHIFIFYFLPVALALYYLVPRRARHLLLTALSYLFYGWTNPWFVLLMLFSTLVDYVCGQLITGQKRIGWLWDGTGAQVSGVSVRQRKVAVIASVVTNLSLLGFFKYFVFVQTNLNWILETFGHEALAMFQVTLPIGISFYTFQSMSYSIDLYRGQAEPASSFSDFACYVAMFPQLIAGPIVRYRDVAEQIAHREHTLEKFSRGIMFFILGFAKKVLLANPMGEVADATFGADSLIWYDAWMGVLAYAFQIYFDFSGYSDMAIGLGLMLGFQFLKNFDSPYLSESITDFWRRWHISLSNWLRDYLYIPLGGNRRGTRRTYINLALVMLLGGFWHGAQWKFIVWGGIHGFMLAFERMIGKDSPYRFLPRPLRVLVTFVVILVTWVFFRAANLGAALTHLGAMFGIGNVWHGASLLGGLIYSPDHLLVALLCLSIIWFAKQSWDIAQEISWPKAVALAVLLLLTLMTMFTQTFNPFLYFQF